MTSNGQAQQRTLRETVQHLVEKRRFGTGTTAPALVELFSLITDKIEALEEGQGATVLPEHELKRIRDQLTESLDELARKKASGTVTAGDVAEWCQSLAFYVRGLEAAAQTRTAKALEHAGNAVRAAQRSMGAAEFRAVRDELERRMKLLEKRTDIAEVTDAVKAATDGVPEQLEELDRRIVALQHSPKRIDELWTAFTAARKVGAQNQAGLNAVIEDLEELRGSIGALSDLRAQAEQRTTALEARMAQVEARLAIPSSSSVDAQAVEATVKALEATVKALEGVMDRRFEVVATHEKQIRELQKAIGDVTVGANIVDEIQRLWAAIHELQKAIDDRDARHAHDQEQFGKFASEDVREQIDGLKNAFGNLTTTVSARGARIDGLRTNLEALAGDVGSRLHTLEAVVCPRDDGDASILEDIRRLDARATAIAEGTERAFGELGASLAGLKETMAAMGETLEGIDRAIPSSDWRDDLDSARTGSPTLKIDDEAGATMFDFMPTKSGPVVFLEDVDQESLPGGVTVTPVEPGQDVTPLDVDDERTMVENAAGAAEAYRTFAEIFGLEVDPSSRITVREHARALVRELANARTALAPLQEAQRERDELDAALTRLAEALGHTKDHARERPALPIIGDAIDRIRKLGETVVDLTIDAKPGVKAWARLEELVEIVKALEEAAREVDETHKGSADRGIGNTSAAKRWKHLRQRTENVIGGWK